MNTNLERSKRKKEKGEGRRAKGERRKLIQEPWALLNFHLSPFSLPPSPLIRAPRRPESRRGAVRPTRTQRAALCTKGRCHDGRQSPLENYKRAPRGVPHLIWPGGDCAFSFLLKLLFIGQRERSRRCVSRTFEQLARRGLCISNFTRLKVSTNDGSEAVARRFLSQ